MASGPVQELLCTSSCNVSLRQHVQFSSIASSPETPSSPSSNGPGMVESRKIIDVFHFGNHIFEDGRKRVCPNKVKEDHPSFNTQAGEETFVWVSQFRHILCSMTKHTIFFFSHNYIEWFYAEIHIHQSKCYMNGRKPILPKK